MLDNCQPFAFHRLASVGQQRQAAEIVEVLGCPGYGPRIECNNREIQLLVAVKQAVRFKVISRLRGRSVLVVQLIVEINKSLGSSRNTRENVVVGYEDTGCDDEPGSGQLP